MSTVFTSLSSKCMCNYDFEHGGHTFSLVLGCLIKWWRDHMYVQNSSVHLILETRYIQYVYVHHDFCRFLIIHKNQEKHDPSWILKSCYNYFSNFYELHVYETILKIWRLQFLKSKLIDTWWWEFGITFKY